MASGGLGQLPDVVPELLAFTPRPHEATGIISRIPPLAGDPHLRFLRDAPKQAIAGVLAECTTTSLKNLLLLVKDKLAGAAILRDTALITNVQARWMLMAAERARRWAATLKLERDFSNSRLRAAIQSGELQANLIKTASKLRLEIHKGQILGRIEQYIHGSCAPTAE